MAHPDPQRSEGQRVGLTRPTLPGGADIEIQYNLLLINMNVQFSSSHSASAPLSALGSVFEHQIAGFPHVINFLPLYLSVA